MVSDFVFTHIGHLTHTWIELKVDVAMWRLCPRFIVHKGEMSEAACMTKVCDKSFIHL